MGLPIAVWSQSRICHECCIPHSLVISVKRRLLGGIEKPLLPLLEQAWVVCMYYTNAASSCTKLSNAATIKAGQRIKTYLKNYFCKYIIHRKHPDPIQTDISCTQMFVLRHNRTRNLYRSRRVFNFTKRPSNGTHKLSPSHIYAKRVMENINEFCKHKRKPCYKTTQTRRQQWGARSRLGYSTPTFSAVFIVKILPVFGRLSQFALSPSAQSILTVALLAGKSQGKSWRVGSAYWLNRKSSYVLHLFYFRWEVGSCEHWWVTG
jgi:hypothetical protein